MGAVEMRQGDTVWGLLKQAGLRDRDVPEALAELAELNGRSVAELRATAVGARVILPDRVLRHLPADRRFAAFQGGGRASSLERRPVGGGALGMMAEPGHVLAAAERALPRLFEGFEITGSEAGAEQVDLQLTDRADPGRTIAVELRLPLAYAEASITLVDAAGFHTFVPLDLRDVRASLDDAKAQYDRVQALAAAGVAVSTDAAARPSAVSPRFELTIEPRAGEERAGEHTFTWSQSAVRVRDDRGNVMTVLADEVRRAELLDAFRGDPDQDWSLDLTHTPSGGVGPFASFSVSTYADFGGIHPDIGLAYETLDLRTGDPVSLEDLLGPDEAFALVSAALGVARGVDEEAEMFLASADAAANLALRSFQLFLQDGAPRVALGVSGSGAARGAILDVAVPLPATPALLLRLGLA